VTEPAVVDTTATAKAPDEPATTRRRAAKSHSAKAAHAADSDDPFASRPTSRRAASRTRSSDKDFVDPFGP